MRAALVFVFLAGCAGAPPVGVASEAVGEQQDGFPSPWERALFMASNRARSDPATVKGPQSTVLPAQPPLVIAHDLERSARFHAITLENGKAPLMHESPCVLKTDVGTSGCDGSPSCACATGVTCNSCSSCPAGTAPFKRIGYFYSGANGEVAAAGYGDPWTVVADWVDEAAGADGHRQIVDGNAGVVGFGHAGGTAGACWSTFDVGDFGSARPAPAKIASAAPKPYAGKAGTFRIYATWTDPAGGAPKDLFAVVDATCTALTSELGDPKKNATYYADVPLTNGCHSVYIVGHDAGGAHQSYPTTIAFTINVGGTAACADQVAQPASTCDAGNPGVDLGSGDGGGSGGAGGNGGGGTGGAGGGGAGGSGGGGNGGSGGGSGTGGNTDNPGSGGGHGGISGGCALVPGGTARDDLGLICLCIAALLLAARLRH